MRLEGRKLTDHRRYDVIVRRRIRLIVNRVFFFFDDTVLESRTCVRVQNMFAVVLTIDRAVV